MKRRVSQKTRRLMRVANQLAWANPKRRQLRIAALRKANARPDVRERKRAAILKRLSDPERREYAISASHTPQANKRRSRSMRKTWKERRPQWEAAISRAMTPDVRKRQGESLRRTAANPAHHARLQAQSKANWANDQTRGRTLRAQRRAAKTPASRMAKGEAAKRLWAKRKADAAELIQLRALQTQKRVLTAPSGAGSKIGRPKGMTKQTRQEAELLEKYLNEFEQVHGSKRGGVAYACRKVYGSSIDLRRAIDRANKTRAKYRKYHGMKLT